MARTQFGGEVKLSVEAIRGNLAFYLSKHTPLTQDEVRQQFNEWLLDLTEEIIEVRENQIIKALDANQHIWRERVVYNGLIALIKGEK